MNKDELKLLSKRVAAELTNSPEVFNPLDFSDHEFEVIGAYFLERFGGSLAVSFLLQHHKVVQGWGEMELVRVIQNMGLNRAMGIDSLLEFYGRFTSVPLQEFSFMLVFGFSASDSYSSSYFGGESKPKESGGWKLLSQSESSRRISEQNGIPDDVLNELKSIDRLLESRGQ